MVHRRCAERWLYGGRPRLWFEDWVVAQAVSLALLTITAGRMLFVTLEITDKC